MPLTFRLYLCSHITDTRAERDHLHAVVFPELRRRLGRSGCQLEVVDLRHGGADEARTEGAEGLADAFRKIGECRPWFLGLLGERLGSRLTTLPDELLAAHAGLRDALPASRMELEFWKGILRDDRPAAGLIYCRDGVDDDESRGGIARLRSQLEEGGRATVRRYTLTPQHGLDTPELLTDFGEGVLADLGSSMEAVFRAVFLEGGRQRGVVLSRTPEPGESMAMTARIIQRTLSGRDLLTPPPSAAPKAPLGGGMGEVHRARDTEQSRAVPLKVPRETQGTPTTERPVYTDENVQFTVYRPRVVAPEKWYPLLAFAHLSERPPDAPPGTPDPVEEVYRQAKHALGAAARDYQDVTQDSRAAVPREGELTLIPEVPGVQFNPPRRSFLWTEPVHKEEFRLKANADLDGRTVRGRLTVYLGGLILADVSLSLRVDAAHRSAAEDAEAEKARPYRKIFASYSHRDAHVVQQIEQLARVFGDRYLRDWAELRAGEVWDDRLLEMIRQADVFQLFWSHNSMASPHCRREWEYALALGRPHFVRPTYWEEPLPASADGTLPPEELRRLHFQRIFADAISHPQLQPAGASVALSLPESVMEYPARLGRMLGEMAPSPPPVPAPAPAAAARPRYSAPDKAPPPPAVRAPSGEEEERDEYVSAERGPWRSARRRSSGGLLLVLALIALAAVAAWLWYLWH